MEKLRKALKDIVVNLKELNPFTPTKGYRQAVLTDLQKALKAADEVLENTKEYDAVSNCSTDASTT